MKSGQPVTPQVVFEDKEYDVANCCDKLCCKFKAIEMKDGHAVIKESNFCLPMACACCVKSESFRDYGTMANEDYSSKIWPCCCLCDQKKGTLGSSHGLSHSSLSCCGMKNSVDKVNDELNARLAD